MRQSIATTATVECKVRGCGWVAEIPTLYRLEVVPGALLGRTGSVNTRVVVDEAAVAAFDAYLAGHLAQHEIAETVLEHADDPGPPYRGGEAIDYLDEPEVEPDGWRTP